MRWRDRRLIARELGAEHQQIQRREEREQHPRAARAGRARADPSQRSRGRLRAATAKPTANAVASGPVKLAAEQRHRVHERVGPGPSSPPGVHSTTAYAPTTRCKKISASSRCGPPSARPPRSPRHDAGDERHQEQPERARAQQLGRAILHPRHQVGAEPERQHRPAHACGEALDLEGDANDGIHLILAYQKPPCAAQFPGPPRRPRREPGRADPA